MRTRWEYAFLDISKTAVKAEERLVWKFTTTLWLNGKDQLATWSSVDFVDGEPDASNPKPYDTVAIWETLGLEGWELVAWREGDRSVSSKDLGAWQQVTTSSYVGGSWVFKRPLED